MTGTAGEFKREMEVCHQELVRQKGVSLFGIVAGAFISEAQRLGAFEPFPTELIHELIGRVANRPFTFNRQRQAIDQARAVELEQAPPDRMQKSPCQCFEMRRLQEMESG